MKKVFFAIVPVFFALFLISCGNTENRQAEPQKPVESKTVAKKIDTTAVSEAIDDISKIAQITDPEQAYRIYLDNNGEIERVALAKWTDLMKQRIAGITVAEQAYRIYLDNNGEIERVALAKYKALGGKN